MRACGSGMCVCVCGFSDSQMLEDMFFMDLHGKMRVSRRWAVVSFASPEFSDMLKCGGQKCQKRLNILC